MDKAIDKTTYTIAVILHWGFVAWCWSLVFSEIQDGLR